MRSININRRDLLKALSAAAFGGTLVASKLLVPAKPAKKALPADATNRSRARSLA